jgi:hypothetical protein|eukprot:COSAG02_NODE_4287_length_5546_cov_1.671746_2_plen_61_part_00
MCKSLALAGSLALVLDQEELALLVAVEDQIQEVAVHQVAHGQAALRGNSWLVRKCGVLSL